MDNFTGIDVQQLLLWNPPDPFIHESRACMHELFALKAREIPNAEAVCSWDGSLTYAELDKLSHVVATQLMSIGVTPGTYVPFAFEKSLWAVVATLGILKAGGAFIPVDPNDPIARLQDILKTAKARVVTTSEIFRPIFRSLVQDVVVISERTVNNWMSDSSMLDHGSIYGKPVTVSHPIFVLFTSGSTGRPKGIIHTHASITTHDLTQGAAMSYNGARVLQFAAFTWDIALMNIFTTLLFGGSICIPSELDRKTNIISVINSMRVNYAILTPSFSGLIDPDEVPTLSTLAVGGEMLPQARVEVWAEKVNLIQVYGPAEVGICHTMSMHADTPGAMIGFPLSGCSCWLVDPEDDSRLVAIGTVGELLVAEPTLVQGYLNDDEKTRASFIKSPIWARNLKLSFEKFYKTGDLVKYDLEALDGSCIFIGRKDSQIKLRGQRIDPGEIEYQICLLPEIACAMVSVPKEGCFKDHLVAVVELRQPDGSSAKVVEGDMRVLEDPQTTTRSVLNSLSRVLPAYMIPTKCLAVRSMPFVPSLKIDRQCVQRWLAAMVHDPSWEASVKIDPLHQEEITANILGVYISETIVSKAQPETQLLKGNNFSLQHAGIDSIKAIKLVMFLRKQYGVSIPLEVISSPETTIRELAQWIRVCKIGANGSKQPSEMAKLMQHKKIDVCQTSIELIRELLKDIEDTKPKSNFESQPNYPHAILLTGATGYLGSAILRHLLKWTDAHIVALVQCPDPAAGLCRITTVATRSNWWDPAYTSRLTIHPSNLSTPDLGLSPDVQSRLFPSLSQAQMPTSSSDFLIDTIIHAGAKVHYTLPYATLYPINVSSTTTLLRLAAISPHLRTFLYISGGESPDVDSVSTDANYLQHLAEASGYTLTKNISERVVRSWANMPRQNSAFEGMTIVTVKTVLDLRASIQKQTYRFNAAMAGSRMEGSARVSV